MRFWLSVVLGLAVFPLEAADSSHLLTYEQWAVPRDAEALVAMPALRNAVSEFGETPGARLVIRHPGGDDGMLWAHELRSWLVALGIGSAHIELVPGSPDPRAITVEVQPSGSTRSWP